MSGTAFSRSTEVVFPSCGLLWANARTLIINLVAAPFRSQYELRCVLVAFCGLPLAH